MSFNEAASQCIDSPYVFDVLSLTLRTYSIAANPGSRSAAAGATSSMQSIYLPCLRRPPI